MMGTKDAAGSSADALTSAPRAADDHTVHRHSPPLHGRRGGFPTSRDGPRTETIYYLYVVDADGRLMGCFRSSACSPARPTGLSQ